MKFERSTHTQKRAASEDGEIEIAISSEAPYERWFGIEILRHSAEAIDLSRLGDGRHPLLLGHDMERQIGVLKSVRLDEDKVLRGVPKFSRSTLGQEIKQDVDDDIRTHVSVGYFIDEIEEIERAADGTETVKRRLSGEEFEREMREAHGDGFYRSGLAAARAKGQEPPVFVVTRWTPFEASIVPVPADITVGKGRSAGVEAPPQTPAAPAAQEPAAPAATPEIIIVENRTMTTPEKTPADLELERVRGILALGEQYAKYLGVNDAKDAIQGGKTLEAFKEHIMAKMQSAHSDTSGAEIGLSRAERQRYSLGRMLQAKLTGNFKQAGFEVECSQAVARMVGADPEGFFVPPDVFRRDFNVGTATEAGNLVATELRGDMFTDALRANMVMGQLGVTYLFGLSGNVDLPRKATPSTLGMLTEIGSASETAPVTAKATLTPKRIGGYVEVSKQALIQSGIALENMIRDDLLVSAAVLLENQSINGAGTGAEIRGLRNTTGIGTTTAGANGAAPTWAHAVDLESACANNNAEPDRLAGYLLNTRTRGKYKQTQKGTNLPFCWDGGPQPLNGYRVAVTNNVPNNLTKGTSTTVCSAALFGSDWSNVVIGTFGAPDVVVDPYTKADTGQVKITLNMFADLAHRQPATTAKIEDLLAN
jgi:HK97 family phage major capsid protein